MLQILSDKARATIHAAALDILEETGVRLHGAKVRCMLLDAGALPHPADPERVLIPRQLVKQSLAVCPKSFTVKNRRGESREVATGTGSLYYSANAVTYARGTEKTVVAVGQQELADFTRVLDRLPNVHGMVGTSVREFEPRHRDFTGFSIMARHTTKHLRPCIYTPAGAEAILEMADAINGGGKLSDNMFFTLGYSIVSPLTWSETALELFSRTSGLSIPMMINSEPMAGATSPVTLAGSLALADAEVLSGIVINQALEPGRPCIYNAGFAHVMDMSTAQALTGAPENALLQAAGAEMAAFHGLPCASWALTDSPVLDGQASYEKFMTLLAHTLSSVNIVWGVGNLETSKTISPEAAVIDDEMIGSSLRFGRGIITDDEHLAMGVIREECFNGSFLQSDHTLEHFRQEIRHAKLPARVTRSRWEQQGSQTIEARAGEVVNGILAEKPEYCLTGAQMEKLDSIQKKWMERI